MFFKKRRDASKRGILVKRRDILILLGIWAAGCVMVAVLLGLFYANSVAEVPAQPRPVATFVIPFEEKNTAKSAYLLALQEAQNWQSDVQMVAVSTHWSEATIQDLGKAAVWDFRFFSAARNRVFFGVVDLDNQQVIGRAHLFKLKSTVSLIDPASWVIDSDEAITIWANNGGGVFLENFAGSRVEVLLRQPPERTAPVWDIIGISGDQSQLFYLAIDASTGQVLN